MKVYQKFWGKNFEGVPKNTKIAIVENYYDYFVSLSTLNRWAKNATNQKQDNYRKKIKDCQGMTVERKEEKKNYI